MSNREYEPQEYIIPANIEDSGGLLGGRIKTKNMIEGVVIFLVLLFLWRILTYPFGFIVRTIAFLVIVAPATIIGFIGIGNESFFEWLFEYIFFKKKIRKVVYRLPIKLEKTKKKGWLKGKNSNNSGKDSEREEVD